MSRKRLWIIAAVAAVPILALAWWLGSPLFLDNAVNEAFPAPAADDGAGVAEAATGSASSTTEATRTTEDLASSTTEITEPPEPVMISGGEFHDVDDLHRGSGTATIFELGDGSHVLRLEDFKVTNGPDLHVYLVPASQPVNQEDLEGFTDLGDLKGNIGDQNYDIPSDLDPAAIGSVVIYCTPFRVIFSTASVG